MSLLPPALCRGNVAPTAVLLTTLVAVVAVPIQAASIDGWIERLSRVNETEQPRALVAPDDWCTGGDWAGRYGQYVWVLCGMSGFWDYRGGGGIVRDPSSAQVPFGYRAYIGENRDPADALRAWIHWPFLPRNVPEGLSEDEKERLRGALGKLAPAGMDLWGWDDVRRVLLNPVNRGRRQTSWDDHAEGYCPWFSRAGPHVCVDTEFPSGQFLLSLYFVNKDAHWGAVNRFRDYLVQVKAWRPEYGNRPGWEKRFESAPLLAESRVHDFHDGVYKRFFVQGPTELTLRVDKGNSINTVISGLFVDKWARAVGSDWAKRTEEAGKSQMATLWSLFRRMVALKEKNPAAFIRIVPGLAADVALWTRRVGHEGVPTYLDRLEIALAFFDELLEFEARDQLWRRYVDEVTGWASGLEESEWDNRRKEFWARCAKIESHPTVTRTKAAQLHRAYFETVLTNEGSAPPLDELREFASREMTRRPHLARACLLALRSYYRKAKQGDPLAVFSAEELYAWAQCHRQLGEHIIAAREFQRFLELFPKHPQAPMAAERLRFEREAARHEMRLRNPDLTLAPAAQRPGIVPIPRVGPQKPDLPAPTPKVEVPKVPDDLDPEATTDTPVSGRNDRAAEP